MNSFVDPPQQVHGRAENSSPASVDAGTDNNGIFGLQQIPAEEVQILPASRIVFYTDPRSPAADRFRYLRMRLRELWEAGKLRSLLITSPLPQDGKSTITLNLATALAEEGKRTVLVIEADLHHSSLTQQLGIQGRRGLADCLEEGLNPLSGIRRLEPLGWFLLPAGKPHGNPSDLFHTEAVAGLMQKLSPHFDWILIDSPPVAPLTDTLSLAQKANACLLVARDGRTPRESIEKAVTLLGRERVLGIVLNSVEGLDRLYSGYYGRNASRGTERKDKNTESEGLQTIDNKDPRSGRGEQQ